jgi:AAA domain
MSEKEEPLSQIIRDFEAAPWGDEASSASEKVTSEPRVIADPKYGRLEFRRLSDVRSRSVRFIVPGLLPLKAFTLLAGIGGLGKSTFAAGVAAGETRGVFDDGTPHDVLYVSYEDTAEEVWRPRILAACGDAARVLEVRVPLDEGGVVVLPEDLEALEQVVRDRDVRLVIVDPVVAAIDTALDAHKDQHVRSVLGKLTMTAEDTGCGVLGIGHLNKNESTNVYIRVANSMAFWNAARSVVLVTEDPEDDECRFISQVKANWSRGAGVQRWQVEQIVLPDEIDPTTGRPVETSRLVFVDFAEGVQPGDVLRADKGGDKENRAKQFLAEALADGDWHASDDLKEAAEADGIAVRTLKRAAQDLGYEYKGEGYPYKTWWRLPAGPATGPPGPGPIIWPVSGAGSRPTAATIGPVRPPAPARAEAGPTVGAELPPDAPAPEVAHLSSRASSEPAPDELPTEEAEVIGEFETMLGPETDAADEGGS